VLRTESASRAEKLIGRDFSLVCLSNFLAFFSIYLIVPVLPVYLEEKGHSNLLIGALMSMMVVAALLRPLFGRLSDLRGRKAILVWGTFLLGASSFLYMAFGSAVPLFLVRFLNGFGLAAFHTAAYAIIGDLAPPSRRLQGIALFYISVDVTIATAPVAAETIQSAWGFNAVYAVAGCLALLAFAASLPVREPESDLRGCETEASPPSKYKTSPIQRVIFATVMGFTFSFGSLQTFIVLSSRANGIDQEWLFFTVFAATLVFFRLAVGRKADRWSRRPLILASGVITLCGLGLIAFSKSWAVLALGSFIYALGFAYLPTTLSALLIDRTPACDRGAALGVVRAVLGQGVWVGGFARGPTAPAAG
jgi:MFS family permease